MSYVFWRETVLMTIPASDIVSPYLKRVRRSLQDACLERHRQQGEVPPDCGVCLLQSLCESFCRRADPGRA
jgi:hypothetical protein